MTENELAALDAMVQMMRKEFETGRVSRRAYESQSVYLTTIPDAITRAICGEVTMLTAESYSFCPKYSQHPKYRQQAVLMVSVCSNAELRRIIEELPPMLAKYDLPDANYFVELARVMLRFPWVGAGR